MDLKRTVTVVTDLFAAPIILSYGDGNSDVLERVEARHQRAMHGVLHDKSFQVKSTFKLWS
jgi:hypothetical protein